jgi:PAS domain S-box-containing protein
MLITTNLSVWDHHTALGVLAFVFSLVFGYSLLSTPSRRATKGAEFNTKNKQLCYKDRVFLSLLQEETDGGGQPCYVITDPDLSDNPIIFASDGFCSHTGYQRTEIVGRNCRFLQGPETQADHVAAIRSAIAKSEEASVQLLNYRKNGSTFLNQFFIMPLRDENKKVAYYVGVQREVLPGKMEGENPGWRVFMWQGI